MVLTRISKVMYFGGGRFRSVVANLGCLSPMGVRNIIPWYERNICLSYKKLIYLFLSCVLKCILPFFLAHMLDFLYNQTFKYICDCMNTGSGFYYCVHIFSELLFF